MFSYKYPANTLHIQFNKLEEYNQIALKIDIVVQKSKKLTKNYTLESQLT